jgi:hypothetical protein
VVRRQSHERAASLRRPDNALEQAFHHSGNFICDSFALCLRQFAGNSEFRRSGQVIAKHIALNPTDGRYDSAGLIDDLKTVPPIVDHLLKTPDLALNSAQARYLPAVVNGIVIGKRRIRAAARHSEPPKQGTANKETTLYTLPVSEECVAMGGRDRI